MKPEIDIHTDRERSDSLIQHLEHLMESDEAQETDEPTTPEATATRPELTDESLSADTPTYSITAVAVNGAAHLDVLKTWGERSYAELKVPQTTWDMARINAETAHYILDQDDLQGAMNYVELLAVEEGVLDAGRDDPRLFVDGPPDPFTTIREHELAIPVYGDDVDTEPLEPILDELRAELGEDAPSAAGVGQFREAFADGRYTLLEPVHPDVNYSFSLENVDPHTLELHADKWWFSADGDLKNNSVTLNSYELTPHEFENETTREIAAMDRELLLDAHAQGGLEAAMDAAEHMARGYGYLDVDTPLFYDGLPERFGLMPAVDFETLHTVRDWRLETLPAATPEGQPLGHALVCVQVGDDGPQFLEMAHFPDQKQAEAFGHEFRQYLIPGLLDGPELALEVAKMEGLPATWTTLNPDERIQYERAELTLTRAPEDWRLHNPYAEREARLAVEGDGVQFDV